MIKIVKGIEFEAKPWQNRVYFNSKGLSKTNAVTACWDKEKGEFVRCQNRPGSILELAIKDAFAEIM